MKQRAMTLIELLAVVALLALLAGVSVRSLASVDSGSTAPRTAEAQVIDSDQLARVLALRRGIAIRLRIGDGHVQLVRVSDGTELRDTALPASVSARLEAVGNDHGVGIALDDGVIIDPRGRSVDYQVLFRPDEDTSTLDIAGLTGDVVITRDIQP